MRGWPNEQPRHAALLAVLAKFESNFWYLWSDSRFLPRPKIPQPALFSPNSSVKKLSLRIITVLVGGQTALVALT